jgi:DNA-binding CsgD family transcriptional regulator
VLGYAEQGCSDKVIAVSLGIARSTVSTILSRARKRSASEPPEALIAANSALEEPRAQHAVAAASAAPYALSVGSARLTRERLAKGRVTHLSDRLILVSVAIEPPLTEVAAQALSEAERAVVELMLEGHSNAAIAAKRRCSVNTVANQLAAAYKKLNVAGRRQLRAKFAR